MTDVVSALRSAAAPGGWSRANQELLWRAADEIERLRNGVQWAADKAFAAVGDGDEVEALSEINNNCRSVLRESQ